MAEIYLKKEDILKAQDFIFEDIDVPEWGGKVRIRCMTGTERDAYEASVYEYKDGTMKLNREDLRSKLLARVLVDAQNERVFSDAEIKLLGRKNAKVIDRLFTIAQRINALSEDNVKDLEKN